MKNKAPASTHKKVVIELLDRKALRGYLNPARLAAAEAFDLLTPDGEHQEIPSIDVRAVYFVRDLAEEFSPERKSFLSRPKLDGLWVKLRFRDQELLEGVIPNDLLAFADKGLQITPPDLNANADRIFIPRSALSELTVLGVVGIARRPLPGVSRRKPATTDDSQPRLFSE